MNLDPKKIELVDAISQFSNLHDAEIYFFKYEKVDQKLKISFEGLFTFSKKEQNYLLTDTRLTLTFTGVRKIVARNLNLIRDHSVVSLSLGSEKKFR